MFDFFISKFSWHCLVAVIIIIVLAIALMFLIAWTINIIAICSEWAFFGKNQYKIRKMAQSEYDRIYSNIVVGANPNTEQLAALKARWDMENARMLRTFSVVGGFVALIAVSSSLYSTIAAYKSSILAHPENIDQVKSALTEDYKASLRAESVEKLRECLSRYSVPTKNACIDTAATHYEDQEKLLSQNQ